MNRRKSLSVGILALALTLGACSYETVNPNEVGVKIHNGQFDGQPVKPGRYNTYTWIGDTTITKWNAGLSQAVFTAAADQGDKAGDDSIKVSSLEAASVSLDVTVNYQISTEDENVKCLYTAGLLTNDDIRDRVIRPAVQDAVTTISSFVTAKELKTTRKGELAKVVLQYMQERFGQQPIPKEKPAPVALTSPDVKITQTHPNEVVPPRTGCGITIGTVLIPQVTLPENIQKAVDQAIQAEADAQRIKVEQGSSTAQAEKNRIEAEGDAAAQRIRAQGEADANRAYSASISGPLAQLKAIQACADAIAKTQAKVVTCGAVGNGGGNNSTVVIPAG
jgi:regulator of protease activity HflC (stomatin/prohibitin superfamily)